jgi:hypothetical protein
MVDGKPEAAAYEIFHHAKTAFRTIERQTRFCQRQSLMIEHPFSEIGLMLLDPTPVFGTGNPIPAARGALLRTKILFQLVQR